MDILDHPVTEYMPELAGNAENYTHGKIIWEDVTIGALASHQGGTGGFGKSQGLFSTLLRG